jgi:hypothetical protein
MIRKLLVVAAAVAMPAAALAAVTTIGSAGIAGAAAKTYDNQTCAISGAVTFATPGLSYNGSLTKKTTSTSVSSATSTGTGCGNKTATTSTLNSKIVSPSVNCNTATPPLPGACAGETAKEYHAYDNSSSLASSGTASIVSSLGPKGIAIYDHGNKVTGLVTTDGTTAVDPGGACGTNVGFQLQGNTSVSGLTYDLLLCITGDTGTSTTGSFYNDYIASSEGDAGIVIATGIFGGSSGLTFTYSG